MPGIIPHLLVGISLFLVGEFYFKIKTKEDIPLINHGLLGTVCVCFSFLPDFPLALFYVFHIYSFDVGVIFQEQFINLITPLSLISLILIKYIISTKREPIWMMGPIAILLHVIMDIHIEENGIWI
jgi:hypothetical protein